jgi:hypothetical protein
MYSRRIRSWIDPGLLVLVLGVIFCGALSSPAARADSALDARVSKYLSDHRADWHDWNVPYEDGQVLHDLILRHKHTRALEIGTSTGHSAIWIAWALSKTGGKRVTIDRTSSSGISISCKK